MVDDERLMTCMLCHEPCLSACPVTMATRHHTYAPSRLAQAAWSARRGEVPWSAIADTLYYCIHCHQCTEACVYAEAPMEPGSMLLAVRQEMQTAVQHPVVREAQARAVAPPPLPKGAPGDFLVVADRWAPGAERSLVAVIRALDPRPAVGYVVDLGWELGLSGADVTRHLISVGERIAQWPGEVLVAFPRDAVWLNQLIAKQWGVILDRPVEYFARKIDGRGRVSMAEFAHHVAYHPSRYVTRDLKMGPALAEILQVDGNWSWWQPGTPSPGPAIGMDRQTREALVASLWEDLGDTEFDAVITDDPYVAEALRQMARTGQRIWLVPEWLAIRNLGGVPHA